jgi:glycosyltransferase involved in cell wall biosynthesis
MLARHHQVNASIGIGLQNADRVIYQSYWGKEQLDEILFPVEEHYAIIPNGVNLKVFSPGELPTDDIPVLGTVGVLRYRYRLETLFQMSLRLDFPHKLLIIGSLDRECQDVLNQFISSEINRGKIEYHPFVQADQLPDFYRRMSILIHPVMGDVCPNVVVEALACGIPVVAPEFGGTAEIIAGGGVVFKAKPWSYDETFIDSLTLTAQTALQKRAELSKLAREQAENQLDDQIMTDRYLQALELPLFTSQAASGRQTHAARSIKDVARKILLPARYVLAAGIRQGQRVRHRYSRLTPNERPRIAFTLFDFQIGGIESWLYRLAIQLGDQFDFYFIATKVEKILPKFQRAGKCQYINQPAQMVAFLQKEKIDILQVHNERWPIDAGLAAGVPRIIERLGGQRSWRRVPKYGVDLVIASSKMAAEAIKGMIPIDRIKVIYNGIDLAQIESAQSVRIFPPDSFIVGRTSRFGQGQNLGLLIQAIAQLRRSYPNIRLVLVGGDSPLPGAVPVEEELKELSRKLEVDELISFQGFVEEAIPTIKGFDLATCVSNDEGIPNSLLEAMACEKPVISTDVGAVSEFLVNGVNGLLIPPRDLDALCDAIEKLMNDPFLSYQLARAGRKTIEQNFNLVNSANQYALVYLELLGI